MERQQHAGVKGHAGDPAATEYESDAFGWFGGEVDRHRPSVPLRARRRNGSRVHQGDDIRHVSSTPAGLAIGPRSWLRTTNRVT